MNKLISVLMPTNNALEGLRKALSSIKSTATKFDEVEIILRVDEENQQRQSECADLMSEFGVQVITGPRGVGYLNMCTFLDDLAKVATGRWSWLFDDDAWVEGNWQYQLEAIPFDADGGPALNAEFYHLGQSRYSNWPKCSPPGLIMPTEVIKRLEHRTPVDQQWLDVATQSNWRIRLLKDVTYYHEGRVR